MFCELLEGGLGGQRRIKTENHVKTDDDVCEKQFAARGLWHVSWCLMSRASKSMGLE